MNVSILICTYGADEWRDLATSRAYPSALKQGARDIQVVHQPTGTLAQARNHAVERTQADWLCFLDADDELEPGYIQAMNVKWFMYAGATCDGPIVFAGRLMVPPRALLAPAVRYIDLRGRPGRPAIPNIGGWPVVNECVIGTLVQREVFLEVGGFRDLPSLEDYDLWLRCAKAGAEIVHAPQAIYRAHVRAGSRNTDQSVYERLRREHAALFV